MVRSRRRSWTLRRRRTKKNEDEKQLHGTKFLRSIDYRIKLGDNCDVNECEIENIILYLF